MTLVYLTPEEMTAGSDKHKLPKEQRIANREATPMMQAFRQIENSILINLGPHYKHALREIAVSTNNKKDGTYTDAVIMLIDYYRKSQKESQWKYDHPTYV